MPAPPTTAAAGAEDGGRDDAVLLEQARRRDRGDGPSDGAASDHRADAATRASPGTSSAPIGRADTMANSKRGHEHGQQDEPDGEVIVDEEDEREGGRGHHDR